MPTWRTLRSAPTSSAGACTSIRSTGRRWPKPSGGPLRCRDRRKPHGSNASAGLGGGRGEMLRGVDLEALLGDIGAAAAPGALRERRHLQDLEVLVADVLEPVARIARCDRALVRAELAH